MKYFTSDLHLGDDRIGINDKPNLFYRPFNSVEEQNNTIINNIVDLNLGKDDELFIVGDVIYNTDYLNVLDKLPVNCRKVLIIGNYDEDIIKELIPYFNEIRHDKLIKVGEYDVYLNHYPIQSLRLLNKTYNIDFAITGHVHGLWKVQINMINVSTDAWHFKPVSEEEILFCYNGMVNHYDSNVFPYEI